MTKARPLTEEALAQFRQAGHKWGAAAATANLGYIALCQSDYVAARAFLEESLMRSREIGDKQSVGLALQNLGLVAHVQGNYVAARALYAESLAVSREAGDKMSPVLDLIGLAGVAAEMGEDMRQAAQLAGATEALRAAIGLAVEAFERGIYERTVAAAQTALGEEAFNAAFAAGQRMTLDEAVAYALGEDIR
jgi:tetratricopeptide (TPR) repeat protein